MSIQFHFCELYNNFPLNQNININKSCVEKVLSTFEKEGINLKQTENLLFFFFDRPRFNYPEELGAFIDKKYMEYEYFENSHSYEINKINNFSDFDNIILLSKKLGECENEIFKVLTIAHECQHFVQKNEIKNIYLREMVLKKYLKQKRLYSNKIYRELPTEVDSFRTSKIIAYRIYGKENVEKFINEEIEYYRNRLLRIKKNTTMIDSENEKKNYWEYVKSINPNVSFNLKIEFEKIWDIYEKDIKDENNKMSRIPTYKRKDSERNFLRAYDFYKKHIKR
ncbi:MAG: hypothetical protein WCC06_07715 [Candidatus Aminicenantales bacterium]